MARIQQAPEKDRLSFGKLLNAKQVKHFDNLLEMVSKPRNDLDWCHQLGTLTLGNCSEQGHGQNWISQLARPLGPKPSLLHKARRFVELYPRNTGADLSQSQGLDWSRLPLTFVMADARGAKQISEGDGPGKLEDL